MIIDTNVIIRYLVESPDSIPDKFKGVFSFFPRLETGELKAKLPDLVLFQTLFVLTSFYKVPQNEAAQKLLELVSFRGIQVVNKDVLVTCLRLLTEKKVDVVDAYILAYAKKKNIKSIYSFDKDLQKLGLTLLPVE